VTQQAQSAPQKAQSDAIKLACSGTLDQFTPVLGNWPVSGVYVVIGGDAASIYNVPMFPEYQRGMTFDVYAKNPSKLFMRNRNQETVVATIDRITGDINIEERSPAEDRFIRWFKGKCTNAKPVF
jgi:hypothetical protein